MGPSPLAVMNDRLMRDPEPARERNQAVTAELDEVLSRALERDPRHRYATASEMAWDLEHPELLGLEERPKAAGAKMPGRGRLLLYAGLALVPLILFGLMLALAGR